MMSSALKIVVLGTALFTTAQACVEFGGHVQDGFSISGDLSASQDGKQVCSGSVEKGDKNLGKWSQLRALN